MTVYLRHVVKNQAIDAIRSTMDIPSTSRWYVVFLGARFQTRKATVDDPRMDANAVNFGAIATAFCWARVDMMMMSYRGIGGSIECSAVVWVCLTTNGMEKQRHQFFCTKRHICLVSGQSRTCLMMAAFAFFFFPLTPAGTWRLVEVLMRAYLPVPSSFYVFKHRGYSDDSQLWCETHTFEQTWTWMIRDHLLISLVEDLHYFWLMISSAIVPPLMMGNKKHQLQWQSSKTPRC